MATRGIRNPLHIHPEHRMHYTGQWHPTLHGIYIWHCIDCGWYLRQYGCDPEEKWEMMNVVYPEEIHRVCRSCVMNTTLIPMKRNDQFECCKARAVEEVKRYYGTID